MPYHHQIRPNLKPRTHFIHFFCAIFLLLVSNLGYATTIVIKNNQIINKPTTYKNVTLDLTQGEFTIEKGGFLTIEDSIVNVTISPSNRFFAYLTNGNLLLKNNLVNVKTSGVTQNSKAQSLYQLIQVDNGLVTLSKNNFSIDTPFTVGFLTTNPHFITKDFTITNNTIKNFHGGIYLLNSYNAIVDYNCFDNVSFSNIFNMGNTNNYKGNIFSFPGNLALGDAFDIINSDNINIIDNIIASSSNYGIYIMGAQNIFIDNNKITDGSSYGVLIQNPAPVAISKNTLLSALMQKFKVNFIQNNNITISNNYIALNRYGIAGEIVHNLTVTDNTFIQKFTDSASRQFWTNNDILLPSATNLVWNDNVYKEAFTQDNGGDNSLALQFVVFPAHGGVAL